MAITSSPELIYQCDSHPLSKVKILPNGAMHWIAPIARTTLPTEKGLPYLDKEGKLYYQQVDASLLSKTIDSFKGNPTTLGHPREKNGVTPQNAMKYMRGITSTGDVTPQTDRHIWMCGTNLDAELIQAITSGQARQISPGYGVKLAQTDQSDVFNQIDRVGNHIAFLPMGRNGKTVALNLDDGSDIPWDFYSNDIQIDGDYLALLQRELQDLPSNFLQFEYVQKDQVDLTPHVTQPKQPEQETTNMKTFQIVGKNGQVLSFQSDSDDVSGYIASLRTDLEEKTIEADNAKATVQTDSALQTEVTRLTTELEQLKAQKPEQQNDEALTKRSFEMATGIVKVLPHIYRVKPDFNLDGITIPSEVELKRQYLVIVNPNKKDTLMGLDLQGDAALQNSAYIEGVYETTISLQSQPQQQDASPLEPSFMKQFRMAVKGAVPQLQNDRAQFEADKQAALQESTKLTDSNF